MRILTYLHLFNSLVFNNHAWIAYEYETLGGYPFSLSLFFLFCWQIFYFADKFCNTGAT